MTSYRSFTPTRTWALKRVAAVLAAASHEHVREVRRGGLRGREHVPRSPQDVTPDWLTAALCQRIPGARVVSLARGARSAGTTTRCGLRVSYNAAGTAAGLPERLFVKCTTTPGQRLMLGLGGLIHGEPGFYRHIRPRLEIEAPRGYFAAVDPRSWRSIVVLEDVRATRGASFSSWRLSRAQVADVLGSMATWHGTLWASPQLALWRWLKTPAEHMAVIEALIGLADRTRAGAARARQAIAPTVRRRQGDLYQGLRRSMWRASQGPRTYLHGDLHVANTYLTAQGSVGVCDWQTGLQGLWAHDYAYLMATALEVAERRACERELLEVYLDRLSRAGGPRIPGQEAWLAYRQAIFYPYFAWLYTLGRSRLQPSFQPEAASLMMIERISAAIEDLESFRALGL